MIDAIFLIDFLNAIKDDNKRLTYALGRLMAYEVEKSGNSEDAQKIRDIIKELEIASRRVITDK